MMRGGLWLAFTLSGSGTCGISFGEERRHESDRRHHPETDAGIPRR
jgi:hypothetical protein